MHSMSRLQGRKVAYVVKECELKSRGCFHDACLLKRESSAVEATEAAPPTIN